MKYKKYIKNSTLVSNIGLGGWQLGEDSGWKSLTEKDASKLIEKALELGINFFDTAPSYGYGTSEERLGKVLKNVDRSTIVINSKFGHTSSGVANFNSNHIRESLEESLKRLQVDYIDSLILHNPPVEYLDGNKTDHYYILEQLVDEGKIKAYGASLDSFDELKLFTETTNAKVVELFFNMLHQGTAQAFDTLQEKEIAVIAKIPLDSGWLSGKYHAESTFNDIRSRWSKEDIVTRAKLVDRVQKITHTQENLAQKAISFCMAYDAVSTVIPGNMSIAQLTQNVDSINNPLSKDVVKELEQFYEEEVKKLNLPW